MIGVTELVLSAKKFTGIGEAYQFAYFSNAIGMFS
jgi:hypothetical protein